MNKEVIFEKERVVVKDHNGNMRNVVAIDNLDEVLIQENIVEMIEKVIYALEDSSTSFKNNKIRDLLYIPSPIISSVSIPTLMLYLNTGDIDGVVSTKFGLMEKDKFLALFILIFFPIAYRMSKKWYEEYKEESKCENGRLLALYHLKNNLIIQNMRLDKLRNESKEIDVLEDKKYHLDEDKIDILQSHINLYYELGYNIKEYYEYFRINGCLPEEVMLDYNDSGIKIIEEYLIKNGSKVKKFKNR